MLELQSREADRLHSFMLKEKLVALLKIRAEETRMVLLMAALFLCVQAGQGIGENAAFALFLGRVDVDQLPYMYMGLGLFVALASLAYATSLSRFRDANVVSYLLAIAVFLFLVEWVVIILLDVSIYWVLWLTTYGMSVILGTLLWTIAGEVCDARQAKRLFSLFASMGILGSVLGNLLTGVFAKLAGTDSLIILYAALLTAGFFLTRHISGAYFRSEVDTNAGYSLIEDMRAGFDFVRGSRLFQLVALSSILYSILFFTVDFPFSEIVSNRFAGDDASLAAFKGVFTSITTTVTFLVSLFLASRLYTRFGIIGSILIMPITYVIAFIVFFVSYGFAGAVFVRFSQLVVLGGFMGTAWNALFNVVPPERRGQVLAFNNGIPAQIGVFLSGVMIVLSRQVLETHSILLLGAVVAFVSVYITLKMKPAYGEALLSALRAGRMEVFSEEDEAFSGYQNDPAALQALVRGLHDPKASIRQLAVEMSAKTNNRVVIPDLIDRLYDDDGGVRAAATRALVQLDGGMASKDVLLGLDDPDDAVRAETLASLPQRGVNSTPDLIRRLELLFRDANVGVAARAALVLIYLCEHEQAGSLFAELLKHRDVDTRRAVLQAFGHVVSGMKERLNINPDLILAAFSDDSAFVRRDAVQIAPLLRHPSVPPALAVLLADEDVPVRRSVSESLKQLWPESRSIVLQTLQDANSVAAEAALNSIPVHDVESLPVLRSYIQREVSRIRHFRSLIDSLPRDKPVVSLLVETLAHRASLSEEHLIKAVGLFGNSQALNLIRRSLNAGDASTRAAALEALETLGDKEIIQEVLPILDRGGVFQSSSDEKMSTRAVIEHLLSNEDKWLQTLATRAIPELGLQELQPALRTLKMNRNALVKLVARDALAQMDGTKMKTLKTLSTMDRILLLREVPMFSGLTPEDLEQIAEIAQEQLYPAGGIVCREGEPGNALYIIVSGEVEILKTVDNHENILSLRGRGDFVGEMAVLEAAPRSATVRTLNEVRILSIEGDSFNSILLDRPAVAVYLLKNMSTRMRVLNEMVGR